MMEEQQHTKQPDQYAALPVYQCHKRVRAAKITWIARDGQNIRIELRWGEVKYRVIVDDEWLSKHHAVVGGYFVVYDDGYTSYSPAKIFEEGYTQVGSLEELRALAEAQIKHITGIKISRDIDAEIATIEQEIQDKGLTAPRVTPADIEANIIGEYYFTAYEGVAGPYGYGGVDRDALGLLTFCVLVLKNGFTVTGESACASPENFDAELGRKIAHQNAISKVWPLMGYELKQRLSNVAQRPL